MQLFIVYCILHQNSNVFCWAFFRFQFASFTPPSYSFLMRLVYSFNLSIQTSFISLCSYISAQTPASSFYKAILDFFLTSIFLFIRSSWIFCLTIYLARFSLPQLSNFFLFSFFSTHQYIYTFFIAIQLLRRRTILAISLFLAVNLCSY